MRFLLIALALAIVGVTERVNAQVCPEGICPTAGVYREAVGYRVAPIRTFALNTATVFNRTAWEPVAVGGGSAGKAVAWVPPPSTYGVNSTYGSAGGVAFAPRRVRYQVQRPVRMLVWEPTRTTRGSKGK